MRNMAVNRFANVLTARGNRLRARFRCTEEQIRKDRLDYEPLMGVVSIGYMGNGNLVLHLPDENITLRYMTAARTSRWFFKRFVTYPNFIPTLVEHSDCSYLEA